MNEIIYFDDGTEIIPVWKQCGERDPNWSDDEKWLWDSGGWTQHMLYVNKEKINVGRAWWVWKEYERGTISLDKNGIYNAHFHVEMTRWDEYGFKTLEETARRLVECTGS
jgi:hypothetical protein